MGGGAGGTTGTHVPFTYCNFKNCNFVFYAIQIFIPLTYCDLAFLCDSNFRSHTGFCFFMQFKSLSVSILPGRSMWCAGSLLKGLHGGMGGEKRKSATSCWSYWWLFPNEGSLHSTAGKGVFQGITVVEGVWCAIPQRRREPKQKREKECYSRRRSVCVGFLSPGSLVLLDLDLVWRSVAGNYSRRRSAWVAFLSSGLFSLIQ